MKLSISRYIFIVMFLALMALVINAAIPINALRLLDRSHDDMATARATIGALDQVMLSMVDAQTGSRGYIITGNPDFLEPYYKAITQLDDQLLRLQGLVRHDKSELKHFRDIEEKCKFSLERLRSTIATRQSAGAEAAMAMVASAEGKRRMDAVRAAVENLRTWENAELDKLKAENDKIFLYTSIALVVLTIIDFILLVIAFVTLYRALKPRAKPKPSSPGCMQRQPGMASCWRSRTGTRIFRPGWPMCCRQ